MPSDMTHAAEARALIAEATAVGQRLDQFLVQQWPDLSRARVQQWIVRGLVQVNDATAKASLKLRGGEHIAVVGDPTPEPIRAVAEEIPLDIVYEDNDLAVIAKPAGMMVHAGSGATEEARSHGTLVNALLHYFGDAAALSSVSGPVRPGIVHRLDKQTSGLILVAKHDRAHRKLAEMFATRRIQKTYIALVHGHVARDTGTLDAAIHRDRVHRTRMTTKGAGGRSAISHYRVLERISGVYGRFTLLEVRIETGRTHQIRVHLSSIGHPVVGDALYGAPKEVPLVDATRITGRAATPRTRRTTATSQENFVLDRNFLHAAKLALVHPESGTPMQWETPLPVDLTAALDRLRSSASNAVPPRQRG